jgi:hypothetical protein
VDIIKYFYEEPTLLESLTPDEDPDARRRQHRSADVVDDPSRQSLEAFLATPEDYYRGYLAGANRTADRVGLTAIEQPGAFVEPVFQGLGAGWWAHTTAEGAVDELGAMEARAILRDPSGTAVLVTADAPVDNGLIAAVAGTQRRYALDALRALLNTARCVAFFPEPAHDGFDWSFFAAHPMRERLTAAFKQNPVEDVRRFALPYQKARSESKFYFETWQLSEAPLPAYIEEV